MLTQREAALAQREAALAQREASLALREATVAQREAALVQHESTLARSDAALNAFDRLRVREVAAWDSQTASTLLARFLSTAVSLEPDERIKLEVHTREGTELLKAVLADPQASKICSLSWEYDGEENVNPVIPLLINSCPELASLQVNFKRQSAFDFICGVLEHPSNKVLVLEMPKYVRGSMPRFFAALGKSKVSALTLFNWSSPKFCRGLCGYLAKDLLVRLTIDMDYSQVPSELETSLANCTCLIELECTGCEFSQPTAFAQSLTKLDFHECRFVGGFDWSFLADSSVQELGFHEMEGVDGTRLGRALAVHLRAKGLDRLCFWGCDFVAQTLAVVGAELGQAKRFETDGYLNQTSVEVMALALRSPRSELRELRFPYEGSAASKIATCLVPALRHPSCNLAKLSFFNNDSKYEAAAKAMENQLCHRRALFALLQGQQVRRLYCPLQRLPVEMLRMVGMVLM